MTESLSKMGNDTVFNRLNSAVRLATERVLDMQSDEGYWWFELEADCTITAEYIMMMHFIGDIDVEIQRKMAVYLRSRQSDDGSYPLFTDGPGDISCSVKVYYALKMAGDDIEAAHMVSLRRWILSQGGAAKANVFTRIALAMFKQLPWRGVPFIPVEIMLFPKWFWFHIDKVAYWSRTVMVPLFILCTLEAEAKNPHNVGVLELFVVHPDEEMHYFPERTLLNKCFLALDALGRKTKPWIDDRIRRRAIDKAVAWFTERLNGEDGLGAIFPAMVNAYEAMLVLGYSKDHPDVIMAKKAIDKLLVVNDEHAYCQPCLSPVWDTGLMTLALQEADRDGLEAPLSKAFDWLKRVQLKDEPGDWRIRRPRLEGGGWAFQFANPHYPDVDDTAVVAFSMAQSGITGLTESVSRAGRWILGMQSENGGYGAFDVDNTYEYLNEIPFADHGALLDPPTADVSARCLMLMARIADDDQGYTDAIQRVTAYLRSEQEMDGSWFGRWGTNHIYGTWSVLLALEYSGIDKSDPMIRKAVAWLESVQREDGGWGEDNLSYHDNQYRGRYDVSTAFQTAWAVLALLAAGEYQSSSVEKGVAFLLSAQKAEGLWEDRCFTAPGFPRVFYLKYHGYDKIFPLWALAKYRNGIEANR